MLRILTGCQARKRHPQIRVYNEVTHLGDGSPPRHLVRQDIDKVDDQVVSEVSNDFENNVTVIKDLYLENQNLRGALKVSQLIERSATSLIAVVSFMFHVQIISDRLDSVLEMNRKKCSPKKPSSNQKVRLTIVLLPTMCDCKAFFDGAARMIPRDCFEKCCTKKSVVSRQMRKGSKRSGRKPWTQWINSRRKTKGLSIVSMAFFSRSAYPYTLVRANRRSAYPYNCLP